MAKKKRSASIDEQLLAAVEACPESLHAIATKAGIPYPRLHGFAVTGTDIRLSTASRLAAYLGLELRRRS